MLYKTYENQFETYFFTFLKVKTDVNNCYFDFPTNDSFTYCIRELFQCQENVLKDNRNNNYIVEVATHFYEFLEKDRILKKVNSLDYAILMDDLKDISEGKKLVTKEKFTFYLNMWHRNSNKYFRQICSEIIKLHNFDSNDYQYVYELSELFLNEILARDIDIRYIHKTVLSYESGIFGNFDNYINYFINRSESSYNIYLPIKNAHEKDVELLRKREQTLELVDGIVYAKVYLNNCIDYFTIINDHMTRIASMFNLLKLYTKTKIDFDFEKNIKVENIGRYHFGTIELPFEEIVVYKGAAPYLQHLNSAIDNLNKLAKKERENYHKLLNIVTYAEKDNDIISTSAYVDCWIALESLVSLSGRDSGYSAVREYLPIIISSKVFINKLTYLLSCSFSRKRISAEDFIRMSYNKTIVNELDDIDNPFFLTELKKLSEIFIDFKRLREYFRVNEKSLKMDILRIYMLRNEYVHESNLTAFHSLQPYKLKNYLTSLIDEFFKSLALKIGTDYVSEFGYTYDIFTKIIEKNQMRELLFQYVCEKRKTKNAKNDLDILEIGSTIGEDEVMINIVLNNTNVLKKYESKEEYSKRARNHRGGSKIKR